MCIRDRPVKTLTKVNIAISQGFAAAERILPIIDIKNEIDLNIDKDELAISKGDIIFENVNFTYKSRA